MKTNLLKWKKTSNHNYIFSFLKSEELVNLVSKVLIDLGFEGKDILEIDLYYPDIKEGAYFHLENSSYFIDFIIGAEQVFMFVQCSKESRKPIDKAFQKQGIDLSKY